MNETHDDDYVITQLEFEWLKLKTLILRGGPLEPIYQLPTHIAMGFVCMITEEIARANGEKVEELFDDCARASRGVNAELGRYGEEENEAESR